MNSKQSASFPHLAFVVEATLIEHFSLLLQHGVVVKSRVGCTILLFLQKELGAGPETIEKIQSVMLDGKPVDDIRAAIIRDGATLALSAAMPGLVGATLRRGGTYSSFRGAITYRESSTTCVASSGFVKIKLFNLLMAELGPCLLGNGVLIQAVDFLSFAAGQSDEFWRGCRHITLDEKPIDAKMLQDDTLQGRTDQILLSVSS